MTSIEKLAQKGKEKTITSYDEDLSKIHKKR